VRVPGEAGGGKARVTLSFPDWKEARVEPATFEIRITDPAAPEKPGPGQGKR